MEGDAINVDFEIRTDPSGLTDADLPIASGPEAPAIVERPDEIGVGVRDIGQIVSFVETVAQAVSPSGYGDYAAAKTQIERRLGVDVEKDILEQLSGDISASISLEGKFGVRVEPKDPEAFERTLGKIAGALPTLAEGLGLDNVSLVRPKAGEDLYALATADGTSIVFGVKNGVFVITNDPDRADSLALDEPTKAAGPGGRGRGPGGRRADRDQDPRGARRPDPGPGPAAGGAGRAAGPADRLARGGHERRERHHQADVRQVARLGRAPARPSCARGRSFAYGGWVGRRLPVRRGGPRFSATVSSSYGSAVAKCPGG